MPHLVLEYSANIIEQPLPVGLLSELNQLLLTLGPFKIQDIKSRAIRYEQFCVADGGAEKAFVHLQLAILEGRPAEIKAEVSQKLHDFLGHVFAESFKRLSFSITVEIRELQKETYRKLSSGALNY